MTTLLPWALLCAVAPPVETAKTPETLLYVRTTPAGARVTLDGETQGTSGRLFKVPPGVRKMVVEVELDGYYPKQQEVEIRGGRITRVELELEKRPASPSRLPAGEAKPTGRDAENSVSAGTHEAASRGPRDETRRVGAGREPSSGEQLAPGKWFDVLKWVDLNRDRFRGDWRRDGEALVAGAGEFSRIMLPVEVDGSYDLVTEFTRRSGSNAVHIILPVGQRMCGFMLSGWDGAVHGLGTINGLRQNEEHNPATRRPGVLFDDRRYRVLAAVRTRGDRVSIDVSLDDKPLLRWRGKQTSLGIEDFWRLPTPNRPGLGAHLSTVKFHTVRLRLVSGKASLRPQPVASRESLSRDQWVDLLKGVDFERDCIEGEWRRDADAIVANPHSFSRMMLPVAVEGGYELKVEFTRNAGHDNVQFLLPAGSRRCHLELSGYGELTHGLSKIDGRDSARNPTTKRPGTLTNGRRYQVLAKVRPQGESVKIEILLDGRPFIYWAGKQASLNIHSEWYWPDPKRPGLGAQRGHVTFHRAQFRLTAGSAWLIVPAGPQIGGKAAEVLPLQTRRTNPL